MLLVMSALNVIRNYDVYVRITSTFGMLTTYHRNIWSSAVDVLKVIRNNEVSVFSGFGVRDMTHLVVIANFSERSSG